jgi:hypothetical protein
VGLSAAVWLAYYPSLGHGPRADQWCFLLDTVGLQDFSTLVAHTYSYNRTSIVCPGDYHLFRPVLFALLSGEKALFGNNFALWQAAGILLHCLVMYLLLRVMLRIISLTDEGTATNSGERGLSQQLRLRAVAFVLVLYFGLNCAVAEMAIWAHINGYVLFVVFGLGSILLLLEGIARWESPGRKKVWLLGAAWFLTLLSAFTYEIGQLYAVIAGAIVAAALYRRGEGRRSAVVFGVFLGILVLYRMTNFLDLRAHPERAPDINIATIWQQTASRVTLMHSGRYVLYDAVQPFFPSWVDWSFTSRLVIPETVAERWKDGGGGPMRIVFFVALGGIAGLTLIGLGRLWAAKHKRVGIIATLLAFSLFALHLTITVLGRMNLRPGPAVLSTNSYYPYMPFVFLILGVSAICAFVASRRARRWLSNSLCALVVGGLIVLSIVSGMKVHAIDVKGRDDFAGFTRRVAWVERFNRQHGGEADFGLAFDLDSCQVIGTSYGVPITTILFKPYLNSPCPKYVIHFPDGEPSVVNYDQWQVSRSTRSSLCPELVSVGSSYNYFHVDGRYYGVLYWDGCYDPARPHYAYLIKAPTLVEARRQELEKLAEQDADVRAGRFVPPQMGIVLLEEGYKGFNLIGFAGKVSAIPQGEGAFDPDRIRAHSYSSPHVGVSTAEVKSQIERTG